MGIVRGQTPPVWFPQIQQEFSNCSFPLRRCFKRSNVAPTSGSRCGPKSKTCYFGDQVCGSGGAPPDEALPYPTESCTCDGTRTNTAGTWLCQPESCPPQECRDATRSGIPWRDTIGDICLNYELFGLCIRFGDLDPVQNLTGNIACCTCGGGTVDPVTSECSDVPLVFDTPVPWIDIAGDNCSWYAERPQTRCIDFGGEVGATFNLNASDACCACASVTPPFEPSTCQDLNGWTTVDNRTCSEVTKLECLISTETYGISVVDACCKCEGRADNPDAPVAFDPPTAPFTAGSCASNSSRFNMCVKISPKVGPQDLPLISLAESTWSSIILEDAPEFAYDFNAINTTGFAGTAPDLLPQNVSGVSAFYETICGFDPGFASDGTIDDINLCVDQAYVHPDILGFAATLFGVNFARFGYLAVNANSLGRQRNVSTVLIETIIHEVGHDIGIGPLWGSTAPGQVIVNITDCSYIGENANRVFQGLSGCSADTKLPIQLREGSDGSVTCGAHLQEACFLNEIMSPSTDDNGTSEKLSVVTVALLEDLGYKVDYSQADPSYARDDLNASCVCGGNEEISPTNRMLVKEAGEEQEEPQIQRPAQSDEKRASVVEYAQEELEKMNAAAAAYMSDDNNGVVGVAGITVVYMQDAGTDDSTVHSVYVPNT